MLCSVGIEGGEVPRRRRVLIEGGLYHVYNRSARRAAVFSDPEEGIEFVEAPWEEKQREGLTVFVWALMSNHITVRKSAMPLPRSMKSQADRNQGLFLSTTPPSIKSSRRAAGEKCSSVSRIASTAQAGRTLSSRPSPIRKRALT